MSTCPDCGIATQNLETGPLEINTIKQHVVRGRDAEPAKG